MDRSDVERLVRVELGLTVVQEDLREHRERSDERHEEMRALMSALGAKLDESKFRWSRLLTPDLVKVVLFVILSLAGVTGVASALLGK